MISSKSKVWLGDGTFKVSPLLYTQLYTVHAVVHGAVVPMVYAMLPEKKESTYQRVFQVLRGKIVEMELEQDEFNGPEIMILDFEIGAIEAFSKVFTATKM